MASQTLSAGAAVSDLSVGTRTWGSHTNVFASDDLRATTQSLITGQISHYLKATTFGFTIPAGATIDGIVVLVERRRSPSGSSCLDNAVRIVKGGTIGATDRSTGVEWQSTERVDSIGGTTDLWGETWTVADINSSGFGVAISAIGGNATGATAAIDHIQITVHYTPAGGGISVTLTPAGETDAAQVLSASGPKTLTPAVETDTARTIILAGSTGVQVTNAPGTWQPGSTVTVYGWPGDLPAAGTRGVRALPAIATGPVAVDGSLSLGVPAGTELNRPLLAEGLGPAGQARLVMAFASESP